MNITLEEAFSKATQGPLSSFRYRDECGTLEPTNACAIRSPEFVQMANVHCLWEKDASIDAALLAHCRNVVPQLVATLILVKALLRRQTDHDAFDMSCLHPDEINAVCDAVEDALEAAKKVEIPT